MKVIRFALCSVLAASCRVSFADDIPSLGLRPPTRSGSRQARSKDRLSESTVISLHFPGSWVQGWCFPVKLLLDASETPRSFGRRHTSNPMRLLDSPLISPFDEGNSDDAAIPGDLPEVEEANEPLFAGFRNEGPAIESQNPAKESPLIGRWDITVESSEGSYPSWLEITKSGRSTLVGRFVSRFGSARPIARVDVNGSSLKFAIPPQWEDRTTDLRFEAKLQGSELHGVTWDEKGKRLNWVGVRAPRLDRTEPVQRGETIELFNGKNLEGFSARHASKPNGWTVIKGILTNKDPGNDIITIRKFTDFHLVAEFRYPEGSNSGIYLRGRYEAQIEDNFGQEPDSHGIGGIYGFLEPNENPARKPGQWQTYEITLIGRRVSVRLNDKLIIDRREIAGPTGGALDSHESEPGPIMIQGDHGSVEFRKLTLTVLR